MRKWCAKRRRHLLSIEELSKRSGRTDRTVRRWLLDPDVLRETHFVKAARGRTVRKIFVDPATLPEQIQVEIADRSEPSRAPSTDAKLLEPAFELTRHEDSRLEDLDLDEARQRRQMIQPALAVARGGRAEIVSEIAEMENISVRTVHRWIEAYETGGLMALASVRFRADRGRFRLRPETYRAIVQALVTNAPSTSVAMVHRTLVRAVPELMRSESGKSRFISARTVHRVREALEENPRTRLLLTDTDERKEFIRTYAGEVFAAHANDMWQMDMTRCDVLVVDPETGKIFRPRIHAIIDVYSGAVPGVAFSIEEDQTQTDLAILRALVPKPAPYTDAWPIFGTPKRLYTDNGSTYVSHHATRMMPELGIELVHSRPRVSHSRGKIERFFGTFHNFEKSLPGYVGENAVNRSAEEIRRMERNTKAWMARGGTQDPGWGNRFLTLQDYQQRVLGWLLTEYHGWIVDGASRQDHFLESAPAATMPLYDRQELMLLLARRQERTVRPDGSFRMHNQAWTLPDGALTEHAGQKVLVLSNQFVQNEEHLVAWRNRSGGLSVLGRAQPMPEFAHSEEAFAHRVQSEARARRAIAEQKQLRKELFDPNLVVSNVLNKQLEAEIDIEPLPLPQRPKARLQAVAGEREVELPADDWIRTLADEPVDPRMDPKEYLQQIKQQYMHINNRGDKK